MRRSFGVSVAAMAVVVMVLGAPASATHGGPHPTFRLEDGFFTCLGGTKLQNIPRLEGGIPGWDNTAPTQSLSGGGGCVQYENLLTSTNTPTGPYDLAFQGTYTGNLTTVTLEIYYANGPQASVPEYLANTSLLVDGEAVGTATQITLSPTEAGNLKKLEFSFTRLERIFATEDGDGVQEREIAFALSSYNEEQMLFAWDATDAPSRIVFNPAKPAATKIPVG